MGVLFVKVVLSAIHRTLVTDVALIAPGCEEVRPQFRQVIHDRCCSRLS